MDNAELINLVTAVLAEATRRGDETVMTLCEELGRRLVEEQTASKVEVALSAMAEDTGAPTQPAPCPVCDRRRIAKMAAQKRWRKSKTKKKSHLRVVE